MVDDAEGVADTDDEIDGGGVEESEDVGEVVEESEDVGEVVGVGGTVAVDESEAPKDFVLVGESEPAWEGVFVVLAVVVDDLVWEEVAVAEGVGSQDSLRTRWLSMSRMELSTGFKTMWPGY